MEASTETRKTDLLDELAELEHAQWKSWAYNIMDEEELSTERTNRWLTIGKKRWQDLSFEEKEKDILWAEKVLFVIKKHMGIK